MMKLDIGCGGSKKEGYLGVDQLFLPGVDIIHDLNKFPYPFSDGLVDEIWMDQVLEHLDQPVKVIEELYRICRDGALITIGVPYFRSFYSVIDPTHKNFFSTYWFNYFDPEHPFHQKYSYSKAKFKVNKIEFDREFKENSTAGFLHKMLIKIAEKRPLFYESRLSHLFPLNSLTFHLTVLK